MGNNSSKLGNKFRKKRVIKEYSHELYNPKPIILQPPAQNGTCLCDEYFNHPKAEFYHQLLLSLQEWHIQDLIDIIMEYTPVLMSRMASNKHNVLCHNQSFLYIQQIPPCPHWVKHKLSAKGLKIALFGSAETDRQALVHAFIEYPHIDTKQGYGCYNVLEKVNSVTVNYHIYGPLTSKLHILNHSDEYKWIRPANIFFLLFDANQSSFDYAVECYEEIVKTKETFKDEKYAVIFVRTKCETKNVDIEMRALSMAARDDIAYIETSAGSQPGNNVNVRLLFHLALYEYWAQSSM